LVYRGALEIMSTSPFHSEGSPRSPERRRFIRQRVRSLAYVDVVPNNGGIVLNLSENGLALQAVNPFDETRVSLRIQPPKSRKRIEASAEITWISESKREAGLQFLELTEAARSEIAEWVAAEADIGERPPLNDSRAPAAPPPPPKQIVAEPARLREKWSAMLENSISEITLANQEVSANSVNSPAVRTEPKSQPVAAPPKRFVSAPANTPTSNVTVIHQPAANRTDAPVIAPTPSTVVSRVVEFPAPELHVPAAEELFRKVSPPASTNFKIKPAEAPAAVAPAMYSELLEVFAHRFRKPLVIAALSACAAIISLVAGMEIIRQRPTTSPTKLSAQEAVQVPNTASGLPLAPNTSSRTSASQSGTSHRATEHTTLGAIASAFRRKVSTMRHDEGAQPTHRAENEDSAAAKFASPIEPAPLRPTIPAQNVSVASAPTLPAAPVTSPRLVTDSPEINPPPPADPQRRSDCYLLYRVEPLYPREAKEHRVEGTVTIHLQIGADGRVQDLRELSGPSLLVPAALEAAREWRFIPALLNGQPIGAEKDVSIVFQLPR
jgi:TonB family protein